MNDNTDISWHLNNSMPNINMEKLQYIQADGDELEYIYYHFPELKINNLRVVKFYGNDIKKIMGENK